MFCSRRVYFSADSNSTYKKFLKGNQKYHREYQRYIQFICHVFSIQQAAMYVYGSIEDPMFDFLTGFSFTSSEKFLYIKNEIVENNSVNF